MKIIFYLIVVIIFLIVYVRYLESRSIFYPVRPLAATPQDIGLPFEDVTIQTQDHVKVHGWLIKAPSAKSTLLFLHGNAGNIGDRLEKIDLFHRMGLNILIIDYRGYGKSEGHPTEHGVYEDAVAAFDYLKEREDTKTLPIVGYGASLGGTVAVDLAVKRSLACLIVDSTFSSAADMARSLYPFLPTFFMTIKFDSINKIKMITIPKLFIHSTEDDIVPYALGRKLYDAAPGPKEFIDVLGGHNDGYINNGNAVKSGIGKLLKSLDLVP